MATTLQILCPNGRRQNIKVTPNTKLLQVLEEVCTKQSFLPAVDFDLIHGRKAVDLTLAFRFSNLPNNAKLELVKAAVPRCQSEGEVTIALQLEDGQRLQHLFQPSATLWDILEHWESSIKGQLIKESTSHAPPQQPVCIYMRDEIVGEVALKDTTLKKLALTSGKAIIRLVYRPVDEAVLAEIQSKIEQEKVRLAKLQEKAKPLQAKPTVTVSQSSQKSSPVDPSSPPLKHRLHQLEEKMDIDETEVKSPENTVSECCRDVRDGSTEGSSVNKSHPKSREQTKKSDSTCSELRAQGTNALEQLRRLNIPGVEVITPQDFDDLTPEEQQVARALAERFMPGLIGSGQQEAASRKSRPTTAQQFANFKFPEETKGKELYRNEFSEVKTDEYKPCDREAVVYNSNEQNVSKALGEDLPDEFFEVTDTDIKSLYKDLQKQVSTDKPLMTESMRQAELEEKYKQYEHVLMRIQFPDGMVLQGCFRPRETVFALHKFVKEHLEDKGHVFYLYRSPPKQVLSDMEKTLVQAGLAPASLVFFGTDCRKDHHLAGSVRKEICPKRRADELSVKKLAQKQMENLSSACTSGGDLARGSERVSYTAETTKRSSNSRAESSPSRSATGNGEAKVPKWLKFGGKK